MRALLLLVCASALCPARAQPARTVAITVDDLPLARSRSLAEAQSVLPTMIGRFERLGIPATGFVNESKMRGDGEESHWTALLRRWLDAGLDLGNHTDSHPSLWNTPLDVFLRDVERGETVTSRLLAERGAHLRHFRHPYLNTGPDAETKAAFERYLDRRGYRVAPVTIDTDDYIYALAYDRARAAADSALARRIATDYIWYMDETTAFYERLSVRVLGREPAQILLIHANALNADHLDALVGMLQTRGYAVVPLDRALEDPAYREPDGYIGRRGISWLQRWAITRGEAPGVEPPAAEWVRDVAWPD